MKQNSHYFIQKLNALHSFVRNAVLFKICNNTYSLNVYVAQPDTSETRMKELPGVRRGWWEHWCHAQVRTLTCLRKEDIF